MLILLYLALDERRIIEGDYGFGVYLILCNRWSVVGFFSESLLSLESAWVNLVLCFQIRHTGLAFARLFLLKLGSAFLLCLLHTSGVNLW